MRFARVDIRVFECDTINRNLLTLGRKNIRESYLRDMGNCIATPRGVEQTRKPASVVGSVGHLGSVRVFILFSQILS